MRQVQSNRFWSNVNKGSDSECWRWRGRFLRGYGRYGGSPAHRVAYEIAVGPIPVGLEIDHLCRTTQCVNPRHLEPVTHAENKRRRYATYTECVNGHGYTTENTYTRPDGTRDCRTCIRVRVASYRKRKAAA